MKKPVDIDGDTGSGDFWLEDFLPYRLSVAAEAVSHLMTRHYLAQDDLAMPEWRLLAEIGRCGVLSPTIAGELTSMDKVKVSRAAATLVARGLLKQTLDPEDGRGRLLSLTRRGVTLHRAIQPTARAIEAALAPSLTKAEWTALHKSLGKLSQHAKALLAGAGTEEVERAPAPIRVTSATAGR